MKILRLSSIFILTSALMLTACASSDITKVTVYFSKDGHASLEPQKLPLIDRFLNLFTSKAYAQTHNPGNTEQYFLIVTADDYGTSTYAPGNATSISIEVQSGENRVFTLFSFSPDGNYNYIGQESANLSGGNTSISINMYPCLYNISAAPSGSTTINISWQYDPSLNYEGYTNFWLYKTCIGSNPSCDGNLNGEPSSIPITNLSTEDSVLSGQYYYYFLIIDSPYSPGGTIQLSGNIADIFTSNHFLTVYMMCSSLAIAI